MTAQLSHMRTKQNVNKVEFKLAVTHTDSFVFWTHTRHLWGVVFSEWCLASAFMPLFNQMKCQEGKVQNWQQIRVYVHSTHKWRNISKLCVHVCLKQDLYSRSEHHHSGSMLNLQCLILQQQTAETRRLVT